MRQVPAAVVLLALGLSVSGCFHGSTSANREPTPRARSFAPAPEVRGCSYLFHDAVRWQSIGGTWKGRRLRWDERPRGQGRWTAAQERQSRVRDSGRVARKGRLVPTKQPGLLAGCFSAWNLLPEGSWQKTIARNFEVAWVEAFSVIS